MAERYLDLFARTTFSDTGLYPLRGGLAPSPDIIPKSAPVGNPADIIADFNKDMGAKIVFHVPNYIYIRGLNNAPGPAAGKVHLYFSRQDLLNYPSLWSRNVITTAAQKNAVDIASDRQGGKWVTEEPFVWTPAQLSLPDHYYLICRIVTTTNPNLIPEDSSFQIAPFLSENRGYALLPVTAAG